MRKAFTALATLLIPAAVAQFFPGMGVPVKP